ncbi:MAG: hypothetical protein JSS32_09265 [Verrucomicrobia bacterium]|nr:hypothetical protein [Verrucomicrobiota bacterium]
MISSITNSITDNSLVNSIREKASRAVERASELFQTYVAEPVERYAIGDLRNYDTGDYDWNEDKSFGIHKFGRMATIATWKPHSKQEYTEALDQLDNQPNGRYSYRAGEALVVGSDFLLADTGPLAHPHRKEALKHLKPGSYGEIAWELFQEVQLREELPRDIPMKATAMGLLGIDKATLDIFYPGLDKLGSDFKEYSANSIPLSLLRFDPTFKEKQKNHQKTVEDLLATEIERIRNRLNEDPLYEPKGLLVEKIAKMLKANPDIRNLHKNPELKSLVLLLVAVDNLDSAIRKLQDNLQKSAYGDRQLIESLKNEINSSGLIQDGQIDTAILMDKRKMPNLDKLYQESINDLSSQPIVLRYAQKEMNLGGNQVPAGTHLSIYAPKDPSGKPSVFSEGNRKCPGRASAEAIFKAMAVGLVQDGLYTRSSDRANKRRFEEFWLKDVNRDLSFGFEGCSQKDRDRLVENVIKSFKFWKFKPYSSEIVFNSFDTFIQNKINDPLTPNESKPLIEEYAQKVRQRLAESFDK